MVPVFWKEKADSNVPDNLSPSYFTQSDFSPRIGAILFLSYPTLSPELVHFGTLDSPLNPLDCSHIDT